jgi:small subunit ribosomal protein S4
MGKPKFSRKKYVTPSHPWQEDRIKAENELIRKYGLKNKREIWKAETVLRRYRGQARTLLAKISSDPQAQKESDQLLMHLTRMNILPPKSNLDDVLALENESILSRRLQTLTYLKGLANTPDHARQLICHGHIAISGRKITVPSYMVAKQEENEIGYTSDSVLNDTMHPARPRADFKPTPIKKEEGESKEPKEKPKTEPEKEIKEEKPAEEVKDETKEDEPSEEIKKPEETLEQPVEPSKEEEKPVQPTPTDIKPEETTKPPKEEVPPGPPKDGDEEIKEEEPPVEEKTVKEQTKEPDEKEKSEGKKEEKKDEEGGN